ncbi:MAG: recombinase family protein [Acidobacteriia bacterium]|nr:recombinase family protein [Terriglobia bacterium]
MTRGVTKHQLTAGAVDTRRLAVLYARVSSKEQEQGYSIPAQQDLLRPYGTQIGVRIAEEFVDAETAKTTGRLGFGTMIAYFRQHPECRVLLVEKTDRLYRNFKDYVTIDELNLEIHFVKENVILTNQSRSSEKFVHGIKVLMAKNYIDNLSEEVRKGLRTKAAQGLWPSFAALGYVNTDGPDGKRIIVPDPVLGPIVTTLFTWFHSGEYSLKALAKKAYEEGFRFRKSKSKIPVTTLHKMLRNRIYMGEFEYAGTVYQGTHEPLVSGEVWERCQEILDGRHERRDRKVTHDFAFSSLLNCGHCGCSLVGELKKGRYVYYHCTGYRGKCPEPYTREEKLTDLFAGQLRALVIPPAVLEWLRETVVASDVTERAARAQTLGRFQMELDRLQTRLDVLYDDRLDGRIDASTYDKKADEIRGTQQRVRTKIAQCQSAELAPATEAVDLMSLTSNAAELFERQSARERRRLLRLVVQEAIWQNGELRTCFREPFEQLRLSNSVTTTKDGQFLRNEGNSGALHQKWGQPRIPDLIKHSWRNCFDQIRDRIRTARL